MGLYFLDTQYMNVAYIEYRNLRYGCKYWIPTFQLDWYRTLETSTHKGLTLVLMGGGRLILSNLFLLVKTIENAIFIFLNLYLTPQPIL